MCVGVHTVLEGPLLFMKLCVRICMHTIYFAVSEGPGCVCGCVYVRVTVCVCILQWFSGITVCAQGLRGLILMS